MSQDPNQNVNQNMNQKANQNLNQDSAVIQKPFKMKGSKFVVGFIIFGLLVSAVFCYAMYESFLTRPKIKIEEEVK